MSRALLFTALLACAAALASAYPNQLIPEGNTTVFAVVNLASSAAFDASIAAKHQLQVFAVGMDAKMYMKFGDVAGKVWSNWTRVPFLSNMTFDNDPAAAVNADGTVMLFARCHEDDALYMTKQVSADDPTTWTHPDPMFTGGQYSFPTSDLSTAYTPDGRIVIYFRGFDGQLYYTEQQKNGKFISMQFLNVVLE